MEIIQVQTGTEEFYKTCNYIEQNITFENLRENGGTLNYSGLTYNSNILLIALENDAPVGYNSVIASPDSYYIYQIAVKKSFQRKGIGTKMMEKAIEMADSKNLFVTAHVRDYNIASQRMFLKLGFIKANNRKNGLYILNQKSRRDNQIPAQR